MKRSIRNASLVAWIVSAFLVCGVEDAGAQLCSNCSGGPEPVTWNGWQFEFVRPCLTEATTANGRGGGIEIRNAKFNGKQVFFKAHTPILNVKYQNDACGPFRDWTYLESTYICTGTTPSPGRCNGVATTNCANPPGGDVGSFCGVTVDTTSFPGYLVLTSLVRAGWYRYQLEWWFGQDGSVIPRIRWTAVAHPCLRNTHIHFAYWRIDFDIEGRQNDRIEEFHAPTAPPPYWETYDPLFVEMERMKSSDLSASRHWRIRDSVTNRGYLVYPPEVYGADWQDGVAVAPQIADVWALRHARELQEETDDCAGEGLGLCAGQSAPGYWAHLTRFINWNTSDPNYLLDKDVVIWYSAAHSHEGSPTGTPEADDCALEHSNGPVLIPDPSGTPW